MDLLGKKLNIISAGAGAGKTRFVVDDVIEKLKDSSFESQISIVTFTRKATQELKERILNACTDIFLVERVEELVSIDTLHGYFFKNMTEYHLDFQLRLKPQMVEFERVHRIYEEFLQDKLVESEVFSEFISRYGWSSVLSKIEAAVPLMSQSYSLLSESEQEEHFQSNIKFFQNEFLEMKNAFETLPEVFKKWSSSFDQVFKQLSCEVGANSTIAFPRWSKKEDEIFSKEKWNYLKKNYLKYCEDPWHINAFKDQWRSDHNVFQLLVEAAYQVRLSTFSNNSELLLEEVEWILFDLYKKHSLHINNLNYWYIDEFQDTSKLQYELLKIITKNSPQVTVIGDKQQSIYLFREANPELFEGLIESNQFFEKIELQKNYRSDPVLLRQINYFSKKEGKKSLFHEMEPREEVFEETICSSLHYGTDLEQSLRSCVESVFNQRNEDETIALLCKSHADIKEVESYLKKINNINYSIESQKNFESNLTYVDIKFFLKFVQNPNDDLSLIGVLRSSIFNFDFGQLKDIMDEVPKDLYLWQYLLAQKPENSVVVGLQAFVQYYLEHGLLESLKKYIQFKYLKLGQLSESESFYLFSILNDLQDKENLLNNFELVNYLDELAFKKAPVFRSNLSPDVIKVMTVHASKGLEFDHVIVWRSDKGFRPQYFENDLYKDSECKLYSFSVLSGALGKSKSSTAIQKWQNNKILKQEMEFERLFYVAMTRSKKRLYFIQEELFKKKSWSDLFLNEDQLSCIEVTSENTDSFNSDVENSYISLTKNIDLEEVFMKKKEVKQTSFELSTYQALTAGSVFHWAVQKLQTLEVHEVLEQTERHYPQYLSFVERGLYYIQESEEECFNFKKYRGHFEWSYYESEKIKINKKQIDYWVETDEAVWIVDYKTGQSDYANKAFLQLRSYAKALIEMYEFKKPITLVAVFTHEEKIIKEKYI